MKYWLMLSAVLVAGGAAALAQGPGEAKAEPNVCLKIRDLGNLTAVDKTTVMATSRNQGKFIVKLRNACPDFKMLDNYYTLQAVSQDECFDGDDVLRFRYGGLCFVESVSPAPAK